MHISGQDNEVSAEEYVLMVMAAVEARLRVLLAQVPVGAAVRAPEDVAESVAAFVRAEQGRLAG